jgi:uncharacterized membrane protein YfcA
MDLLEQGLLFLVALIANGLSSMAGGGAGLLQLPALIFLGLPFSVALATHKIATVALGLGATVRHSGGGNTDWRFALFMLACGLPGVVLGANVILKVPAVAAQVALGVLTIALGLYSYVKSQFGQLYELKNQTTHGFISGGLVLFLLGFFNGSLTSGTGLFVTMWLIGWFGLDFKRATAYTMILVGIFWNATGAVTLALLAPVKWEWLPALIAGSLLGGYLGAHLGLKYGNRLIKRIFEVVTVLSGIALILKSV